MSVQQAAAWVLDRYHTDFPEYNPYLDRIVHPAGGAGGGGHHRGSSRRGVKVYDIDGHGANINVRERVCKFRVRRTISRKKKLKCY